MTGLWTCKPCSDRLGIDTSGQASSSSTSNWCGAGQHRVREEVRFCPNASVSIPVLESEPPPSVKGEQWSLF